MFKIVLFHTIAKIWGGGIAVVTSRCKNKKKMMKKNTSDTIML